MADNKINVTVSANTRKNISVTSSQVSTEISASADLGRFWADKAKNWAVSDVIVDNIDYSSKHYANNAKESANNAQVFANATKQTYNAFLDSSVNANNELVATRDEALTAINDRFEEGIGDGINQITVLVNDSIAEYTEISNQIKQENSEASKLAKDWATSAVLVDNIDYSAKYYAEKAKDNSGIYYDELADKDVDVEILDVNYATKSDLELGLDTKQDKGNYALVEDIPTQVSELENDSNYATQTQVLQAIASIPQFKLSIVEELPLAGEKMTLYLVPKEGTNNDVYDEYIWIEQTESFEHLGTTAVDLTDYVKNTDYATYEKAGIVRIGAYYGLNYGSTGLVSVNRASNEEIKNKQSVYKPIVPSNLDEAVKTSITTNTIELTDDEKTTACNWLGTAKTVLTTEAEYEALETKDANTLYLIEE